MTKVCAVVPLYNEEKYVYDTVNALKNIESISDIIVVDDGSIDNTWDIITGINNIKKLRHEFCMGKGRSLKDGVNNIDADIYAFVDGDLGTSACLVKPLIDEVIDNNCDVSIAEFSGTGGGIGFLKWFSRKAVKHFTGCDFSCPLSGQRVLKRNVLFDWDVKYYEGYGVDAGMLIDIVNKGYKVKFIELDLCHRETGMDLHGIFHRLHEFKDVSKVMLYKALRR